MHQQFWPAGIVATMATAWLLRGRETHIERVAPDLVGIGLLAVGVGSLQVMLDRGKDLDWWFRESIIRPKPSIKPAKPKPAMKLSALPAECRQVLLAP